jgi:hypothetical protein
MWPETSKPGLLSENRAFVSFDGSFRPQFRNRLYKSSILIVVKRSAFTKEHSLSLKSKHLTRIPHTLGSSAGCWDNNRIESDRVCITEMLSSKMLVLTRIEVLWIVTDF